VLWRARGICFACSVVPGTPFILYAGPPAVFPWPVRGQLLQVAVRLNDVVWSNTPTYDCLFAVHLVASDVSALLDNPNGGLVPVCPCGWRLQEVKEHPTAGSWMVWPGRSVAAS